MSLSRMFLLAKRHFVSFARHNTMKKLANLCRVYYHYFRGSTTVKGHPFEIIIDPVNMCNLKCPLCVTGQGKNTRKLGIMPFENLKKIIDELSPWLYKVRFYSWGEPLLHKDIYSMIAYAAQRNIATEMSTNFTRSSPADLGKLIDSGLENLIVSLDGASEATYSRYRVGGSFKVVVENIRTLIQQRKARQRRYPEVEVQFLVMKHNEHEIDAIRELAEELGVDRIRIAPLTVNVNDTEQAYTWLPRDEKWSRYSYGNYDDKVYTKRKRCEWLWRSMVFNWDGSVSPCCVYEGPKSDLGSVQEASLQEVWNNEQYRSARGVFNENQKSGSEPHTICGRCKGIPRALEKDQHGLY
ncbi:MAG: SPASM domain-containing protein [Nitrospira sp.]|nr:SPASM domain-containing protein [bacterium]MBL7047992.1 SPASM domain-containing protein [Nitrospira sp.]